jgi:hypothetical protein
MPLSGGIDFSDYIWIGQRIKVEPELPQGGTWTEQQSAL